MKITNIGIKKFYDKESSLKAIATITIDDAIAIHNIKLIQGENRMFVGFPSRKVGDKYYDIVHPITSDVRDIIEKALIKKYEELDVKTNDEKE